MHNFKSKKTRKPIFFTSDWHLGHANILQYDARPFKDLDAMHKALVSRFNATVKEDGITYFLGDMGLCKAEVMEPIIKQLNGFKMLILGNHDKNMNAMYAMGFDAVLNAATMYIGGERVTMSHCPLRGVFREDVTGMKGSLPGENWHGESKNQAYSVTDEGQFHLSGHIHSPNGGKSKRILGRQFDVGVAANGYKPVSISEIESWIANYKKSSG